MSTPAMLKIAKFEGDTGYYLYYCDSSGVEMTDTWHESLEKAMEQAEFEFQVAKQDWEPVQTK